MPPANRLLHPTSQPGRQTGAKSKRGQQVGKPTRQNANKTTWRNIECQPRRRQAKLAYCPLNCNPGLHEGTSAYPLDWPRHVKDERYAPRQCEVVKLRELKKIEKGRRYGHIGTHAQSC